MKRAKIGDYIVVIMREAVLRRPSPSDDNEAFPRPEIKEKKIVRRIVKANEGYVSFWYKRQIHTINQAYVNIV